MKYYIAFYVVCEDGFTFGDTYLDTTEGITKEKLEWFKEEASQKAVELGLIVENIVILNVIPIEKS